MATGEFLVDPQGMTVQTSVARVMPIAMAFGLSIVVLAFFIGPISGGHINPAVTLALMIHKRISPLRMFVYWTAQYVGAVWGSLILWAATSNASYVPPRGAPTNFTVGVDIVPAVGRPPYYLGANGLNPVLTVWNGLLLEIVGTSFLVATVLNTAVDKRSLSGVNVLAPLPIGFSVLVCHLALIPWTGCGINPARTFGPHLVNSMGGGANWWVTGWWIYYIGPGIGAILSALIIMILWGGVHPPSAYEEGPRNQVEDEPIKSEVV